MDLCKDGQPRKQFSKLQKYFYDNINTGNYCGPVFIDISKEFDSLYHPRLHLKLGQSGLNYYFLKGFK